MLGTDEYTENLDNWCGVFQWSALESVELPRTLKRIVYNAFKECGSLGSIVIPEGLKQIGSKCFCQSALESIILPSTLKWIERLAFDGCGELKSIVFPEGLEHIEGPCF